MCACKRWLQNIGFFTYNYILFLLGLETWFSAIHLWGRRILSAGGLRLLAGLLASSEVSSSHRGAAAVCGGEAAASRCSRASASSCGGANLYRLLLEMVLSSSIFLPNDPRLERTTSLHILNKVLFHYSRDKLAWCQDKLLDSQERCKKSKQFNYG